MDFFTAFIGYSIVPILSIGIIAVFIKIFINIFK